MEKEYTVIANTREDLPALEADITASSGAGPIPNRSVDIANPRPGSKIQTHFMLTDAEAEALRADPRVRAVEIPPEQRDDISIGLHASQPGQYIRGSSDNLDVNWGLRRCIETINVYGINPTTTGGYDYALDGTGVDVVIQDSGIDPNHPEWLYPKNYVFHTVTSSSNFIDGSAQSTYFAMKSEYNPPTSGVLDIGAYYSLEYRNRTTGKVLVKADRKFRGSVNSPAANEFGFDGQGRLIVGETSRELSNLIGGKGGTFTIGMPLVEFSPGSPTRMQQIDWYTESGLSGTQDANFYDDYDGHGTHCAGIAAGKTYGWAKGARIFAQKLSGLEGFFDPGSGISIADAFDTIRLWHTSKGGSRPTVVNMSWGYTGSSPTEPTGGIYRGQSWTYLSETDEELWDSYGIVSKYGDGSRRFSGQVASVDAEVEDMISDGIHICIAAGNDYYKSDLPGGADYNNEVTISGVTRFYHRPSSPYSSNAFIVGNIDTATFFTGSDNLDRTAGSSKKGPAVNIWAPGTNIMSTTSRNADTGKFTPVDYPNDPTYKIMSIGGTSMAAPQVAGLCALHLQVLPNLTPAQLQSRMFAQTNPVIYQTANNDTDYRSFSTSILGSPNRMLYSQYGKQPITVSANNVIGYISVA